MKRLLQGYLAWATRRTIEREQPFIIAITGTVGKSTTKQALAAMAMEGEYADRTRAPKKNFNNELGIPLTVFDLPAPGRSPFAWLRTLWVATGYGLGLRNTGVRTFILEMGADKPGDLAYLTAMAKPDISVITAVSPEDASWAPVHAANYPTVEALAHEKATLVRTVRPEGTVVLNQDDILVAQMAEQAAAHVLSFGMSEGADVRIISTEVISEDHGTWKRPIGLEVKLSLLHRVETIFLPGVFGRSAAYAWAAAFTVGIALDMPVAEMIRSVRHFVPMPGRARLIDGVKGTMIFDDSYNASPVAVLMSLRDMAAAERLPSQRLVACLGEMRELGEQAEVLHRRVAQEIALLKYDLFVVSGVWANAMAEEAKKQGLPEERIIIVDDAPEAGIFIQDWMRTGDFILAKASEGPGPSSPYFGKVKGVRMERVTKELMADPLRANQLLCRQEGGWVEE